MQILILISPFGCLFLELLLEVTYEILFIICSFYSFGFSLLANHRFSHRQIKKCYKYNEVKFKNLKRVSVCVIVRNGSKLFNLQKKLNTVSFHCCILHSPAVLQLDEALRYKPESRGFDSRWCHWSFPCT